MIVKRSVRLIPAAAMVWLVFAWLAAPAQAEVTMSVSPSLVELKATPGGEGSQEVTIFNEGSEPLGVIATVEHYKDGADERSATSWLKVNPTSFVVAPGQKQKARVSITVPPGLQSGGRYAMVAFKTTPTAIDGSGAGVSAQLGVPFLIAVEGSGALSRQASLEWLQPVQEVDGRVGFRASLLNQGNLHFVSRGEVQISHADGAPVGRLQFPETTAVLPQTEEVLAAQGTIPMEQGRDYRATAVLDAGGIPVVAEVPFTAKAALSLANVSVRENLDKGPTLRVALRNDGELGLLPRVQFAVRGSDDRVIGTAAPAWPPLIRPGQTVQVETNFPQRLATGDYHVVARAEYGAAIPIQRDATFRIGNPLPKPNQAWGEAPARAQEPATAALSIPWETIAAAALVLLVVAGGIGWVLTLERFRRRLGRAAQALLQSE